MTWRQSSASIVSIALITAACCCSGNASAQQEATARREWNNRYNIRAELLVDPEKVYVAGEELVTFINRGETPVNELHFHLYANAFSRSGSVYMSERQRDQGRTPVDGRPAAALGYCRVKSLKIDNVAAQCKIHDTLMIVSLAEPLAPGQSVTAAIEFETQLPETIARMGHFGKHCDVMQWYPKLAVHQNGEWNAEAFHAPTEFFADFGDYDVTITVPVDYVVGSTGVQRGEDEAVEAQAGSPARTRRRFIAEGVHDFAWCADPHARNYRRTFTDASGNEVAINYLCQPYGTPKADWVLDTVERCLELYGEWFVPYPYPAITVDGLPYGLGGGMEYPMLFTISQAFPNHLDFLAEGTEEPSSVTIHEFGHEYWYGLLANDEFREAWLDEGINSYVQTKIQQEMFRDRDRGQPLQATEWRQVLLPFLNQGLGVEVAGTHLGLRTLVGFDHSPFSRTRHGVSRGSGTLLGFAIPTGKTPGFGIDRLLRRRSSYALQAAKSPIRAVSFEMHPDAISPIVYSKTALAMATLEAEFGWDAVRTALKEYVLEFQFRHPTGDDFLRVMRSVIPREVARAATEAGKPVRKTSIEPYLQQLFETSRVVDYAITIARAEPIMPDYGFAPQSQPGADEPRFRSDQTGSGKYANRVLVENLGQVELPVQIELRYEDGTKARKRWNGRGRFQWIQTQTDSPLLYALADPDRKLVLDLNFNNNGRTVKRNTETVRRQKSLTMFWVQNALSALRLMLGP